MVSGSRQPTSLSTVAILLIFLVGIGGIVGGAVFWVHTKEAEIAQTFPLPTGVIATQVDAIQALPQIQAALGGAEFISLHATVVKRDGSVDVTTESSPPALIEYELFRPSKTATPSAYHTDEALAGTKITARIIEKGRVSSISQSGGSLSMKFRLRNEGFMASYTPNTHLSEAPGALPTCPFKQLWDQIPLASTLLPDERADIRFTKGSYTFLLPRLGRMYYFNTDCALH